MNFDLDSDSRLAIWNLTIKEIEDYYSNTEKLRVAPELKILKVKEYITDYLSNNSFESGQESINHVINGLKQFSVHTSHPSYFGLFNPRANFPSIVADLITAAFNPQLAAWSHAPFAAEVENYLIQEFGKKFGYEPDSIDGVFATGGAEANLTAILTALNNYFPDYSNNGLRSVEKSPVIYASSESHHSIIKAAMACGLGMQSVRNISVDDSLSMDIQMLEQKIKIDLSNGFFPLMIIATAGTTGAGVIDPLYAINSLAKKYNMWLHVDAAYGGGLCLSNQSHLLNGIEFANSITFDAHKWMSVPMSASLYLTRHKNILEQTFRITTDYMPKEAKDMPVIDPFVHSIQWSRRFMGLKIYLPFLFFGWEGYKTIINKQMEMGRLLRKKLTKNGWKIYNNTELPVICFGKESFEQDPTEAQSICNKLIGTGRVWLSVYSIRGTNTLRVCITNYDTKEEHIDSLVEDLKNYN